MCGGDWGITGVVEVSSDKLQWSSAKEYLSGFSVCSPASYLSRLIGRSALSRRQRLPLWARTLSVVSQSSERGRLRKGRTPSAATATFDRK